MTPQISHRLHSFGYVRVIPFDRFNGRFSGFGVNFVNIRAGFNEKSAQGDRVAAEKWLREAIALNRAHGHFHHLGKHLMNLGNLYRETGKFDDAEALLNEGAVLIERAGDQYWQAVAARYRGWLARDRGDWAQAGRWLALAERTYDLAGAPADGDATREELARL